MMKYEYKSVLAPVIESFTEMKRELGFKYVSECKLLRRIDQSALNHSEYYAAIEPSRTELRATLFAF